MTKQLLLMRHAKSDWNDSSLSDAERPLNPRGRRAAPQMARWMLENHRVPQRILYSAAVRTTQTCSLMLQAWTECEAPVPDASSLVSIQELYLASPDTIIEQAIQYSEQVDSLLILGHNPGMEILASHLSQSDLQMPTASLAIFTAWDWPENWWRSESWTFHGLIRPKELGD